MKLTLARAEELLHSGVGGKKMPDAKIRHSIAVATAAKKIAEKCGLDGKHAYILGLVHDIGCHFGSAQHPLEGYIYLKSLGFDDEYANICLTHSFLEGDPNCTADGPIVDGDNVRKNSIIPYLDEKDKKFVLDFLKNHKYTQYETIINLCDLMCTDKIIGLDARLIDLISRKGAFSTTQRHTQIAKKIEKGLEEKMGCSMLDIFGEEIIKNLSSGDSYFTEQKKIKTQIAKPAVKESGVATEVDQDEKF